MSLLYSFHHVSKLHQSVRCSRQQSSAWPQIHVDPIKGSIVWWKVEWINGSKSAKFSLSEWVGSATAGGPVGWFAVRGEPFTRATVLGGVERGVVPHLGKSPLPLWLTCWLSLQERILASQSFPPIFHLQRKPSHIHVLYIRVFSKMLFWKSFWLNLLNNT